MKIANVTVVQRTSHARRLLFIEARIDSDLFSHYFDEMKCPRLVEASYCVFVSPKMWTRHSENRFVSLKKIVLFGRFTVIHKYIDICRCETKYDKM